MCIYIYIYDFIYIYIIAMSSYSPVSSRRGRLEDRLLAAVHATPATILGWVSLLCYGGLYHV